MDIIAVTVRLMLLPHWLALISSCLFWAQSRSDWRVRAQNSGVMPPTDGGGQGMWAYLNLASAETSSLLLTNKQTLAVVRELRLSTDPADLQTTYRMPSFLFLLLLYCHGLDRVPIWLGKSHFHQQVGWGTRLVMAQSAELCEYEVWVPLRAVVDGVIKFYIWTCREVA